MMRLDKETAVECLAHQVAAGVHMMLASTHMTVDFLKQRLASLPPREPIDMSVIDDLLAARNTHLIQSSLLADIAFVLGFEWDFKIVKLPEDEPTDTGSVT